MPANTRGNTRKKAGIEISDKTSTSSSPSSRTASGQTRMPPPYDGPLATATSIAPVSRRCPSTSTTYGMGRNTGSSRATAST